MSGEKELEWLIGALDQSMRQVELARTTLANVTGELMRVKRALRALGAEPFPPETRTVVACDICRRETNALWDGAHCSHCGGMYRKIKVERKEA